LKSHKPAFVVALEPLKKNHKITIN